METIIFIGANKSGSSREAIRAAEKMGFLTVLLINQNKFLQQRTEFPDVHEMIFSPFTKEELSIRIQTLKKQGKVIKGILSFIDPYVHLAATLSEDWGITPFSVESLRQMENKIETHYVLQDYSVTPAFDLYHPGDSLPDFLSRNDPNKEWIVKSPVSTGSKDVLKAQGQKELKKAIDYLSNTHRDQPVLLEEYLRGPQYLVEILVEEGVIHIVAVIKQYILKRDRFIIIGYALLTDLEEQLYQKLSNMALAIVQAFNMRNGACHLELRLVNGEWKLIEINPRISGGAMNDMIQVAFGINLVEETIRLYLGQSPRLIKQRNQPVYTHYLTIDQMGTLLKVTGRHRASRHIGVEKVYIKPRRGMIMRPPISMGNRYGYVMATGDTPEQAKETALTAAKEIRFHLLPL